MLTTGHQHTLDGSGQCVLVCAYWRSCTSQTHMVSRGIRALNKMVGRSRLPNVVDMLQVPAGLETMLQDRSMEWRITAMTSTQMLASH